MLKKVFNVVTFFVREPEGVLYRVVADFWFRCEHRMMLGRLSKICIHQEAESPVFGTMWGFSQ